ncbi:hypothetical protein FOCC_FOCC001242 [Frankliniella occidentalis]|uniref:Protein lingerer isoform X1 n=1 Tax=Frankliniella occidentalis TaxID=133901 RepID=A0A6J1SD18_FRAOC|nr:protein lingerer isoform X1 [Frankliniella occidentalis]XP_026278582.1 protein lingerer isoform X1 [Frankliniella occidentalis]XP_026278583.1 protein lingerer isoform X1 [Frankliniella occidentalis]XP_026278584.1 protein lingerer isoform X1 [Frankliniella occidentalis]KAE8752080.1 hypothetical protein FOCC_FOCC001242 [Frankliniella occidentalis]
MSSVGRAASRGSKGGKGDHASAKAQKTDTKTETAKTTENPKAQPTPEQMRIARIIGEDYEDPQLRDKIKQVMDATHKSEEEVATALHDCDNDLNRAVNMLIEGQISGEWETSSKKKKNRLPSANSKPDAAAPRGISSADVESENWDDETPIKPAAQTDSQQRTRTQRGGGGGSGGGGGPPRMRGRGAQDNRGWRGRENKENERNLEESRNAVGPSAGGEREPRDSFRRGGGGGGNRGGRMSNGAGRGGGRGGSRTGPRSFPNRGGHDRGGAPFPRATSWNPDEDGADSKSNNFPSPEDWYNEEYTGSLSDTKVFTPSNVSGEASANDPITSLTVNNSNSDSSPGVNSTNLNYAQSAAGTGNMSAVQSQYLRQLPDGKPPSSNALTGAMSGLNSMTGPLANSTDSKTASRGITPSTPSSGITYSTYAASAANSAANAPAATSYPSTYSSVSASVPSVSSAADTNFSTSSVNSSFTTYPSGQTQPASYTATATSYSTVYGSHQEGATQASNTQALPPRSKTQRPRVPPPSKIPQSAVEMPGDGVNSIGVLDVQFGALDFGTEAFDTNSSEPQSSPQSQPSQPQNQASPMAKYSTGASAGGGMDTTSTPASQPSMDIDPFKTAGQKAAALTQTLQETLLHGSQSQQSQSNSQSQSNDLKSQQSNFTQQSRGPGVGVVVPSPLDSLVKSDQSSGGNVSNVSASGAGAAGSLSYSTPSSNYQSSYTNQKSVGSGYQSTGYNASSYPPQATSGVSSNSSNSYPTSYPSNASNQAYQNVQSVYGASNSNASATGGSNSGSVGSTSGYTTSGTAGGYQNSYGTSTASAASTNKLTSVLTAAKDLPQYDTTATSTSNLSGSLTSSNTGAPGLSVPNVSGSVNNSPSLGLPGTTSLPNANNTTSTKVTNSSAKSVVQNMPPGVQPIIAAGTQYIMSQGGLPYFQQPVYSFEEQQIMPLRIPHMPGYYDISYQQAPTSLATGREGSLANVPYSMSDARFARTDNASPVPSSLSQQNATQAHQQPMMNATGFPPGYAAYAYYGGSVLPANYQYGTPTAMYPQVAPATNAHGNSNSTQYPKPGSYGSSYGSGYDGLSASQDYSKGGGSYAGGHSGAQTANKAGVGTNVPSTGSSATDIYNKTHTHAALSKVNSYDKGFHSGTPPPFNLAGNQNTGMAPSGAFPTAMYIPPPIPQQHHHSTTLMQHPVHQQMDMRNTSRRSESGNNSGQRSQSSSQSSKPGSKQVFSQNYWAN